MIRKAIPCLLATLLVAGAAAAQSADELVEKNLQAKGGRDKIKAIKTLRMSGKIALPQGIEGALVLENERPDKLRMDMTLQGMTLVQAYDGKSGWKVNPFMGKPDAEPMTAEELKEAQRQATAMDGLMDYKERGETIELLGKDNLEGTPVYKLKWTRKDGDVTTLYLDAEQYLEIRSDGKTRTQGQEIASTSTFGDYKPVNGVLIAHSIQVQPEGMPGGITMTFDKIEANPDIPESRFAMPPPAPKEAAPKEAPAKPPVR